MRKCPYGNKVHSRLRDLADATQINAAGSFSLESATIQFYSLSEHIYFKIIEHHSVDNSVPKAKDCFQLIDRRYFDLDRNSYLSRSVKEFLHKLDHPANISAIGRNVIVLDQNHIAERIPVVGAASGTDSVPIEWPEKRRGLSRIEDRCACPGNGIDKARCQSCNA